LVVEEEMGDNQVHHLVVREVLGAEGMGWQGQKVDRRPSMEQMGVIMEEEEEEEDHATWRQGSKDQERQG
jgi:ribosome assembly protein YihI (activator of Der GTPase)